MSKKFRFSKESRERMENYITGEKIPQETPPADPQPTPTSPLLAEGRTDIGKVRATNQDALLMSDRLWGVADGMGGHNGGETASAGARDGLLTLLADQDPSVDALREGVEKVNHQLYEQQLEDATLSGMGTTLSVVWMSDHFAYIGHVGDSRVYLMREGKLKQMTDDHSLVEELYRLGQLTREQAANHPMRNVITRAVGTEETVMVDVAVEERRAGDLWLVCSDGLHGLVSDEQMEAVLAAHSPGAAADQLLEMALQAGGRDNISLVVLLDREGGR